MTLRAAITQALAEGRDITWGASSGPCVRIGAAVMKELLDGRYRAMADQLLFVPARLTKAERKVAWEFVRGQTNAEVASACCITPLTLRTHLKRIYSKLEVRDGRELIAEVLWRLMRANMP